MSAYKASVALEAHKPYKQGNVTSDGTSLWSYGWWELARWVDDRIVVRSGIPYSPSTKQQFSRASLYRFEQSTVPTPRKQATLEL